MKILAVLMAFSSLTALAAERNIYDLMYLPKAGTNFGITELDFSRTDIKFDIAGADVETEGQGWMVTQEVGRSLTDQLLLSLTLDYAHNDSTQTIKIPSVATDEESNTRKGISDPTINARYRVLESNLVFDVTGSFTASLGDTETKGSETDHRGGGHVATLGAEVGKLEKDLQYRGAFRFTRNFESTALDKDTDVKVKDDAHNNYEINGTALKRLNEFMNLKAGLGVLFVDSYDDNANEKTASMTAYAALAELQMVHSKDLLFRVNLQLLDVHMSQIDTYRVYTATLGANYQF